MKKILEFLQDQSGQLSNARLANLLVVVTFIADWISHIIRSVSFDPALSIVGIVTAVMGIKVLQKKFEN